MSDLPDFQKWRYQDVHQYISRVLTNSAGKSTLQQLIAHDDGHYRAIFNEDYFSLSDERAEPSKSQWSTLKKRMKRVQRNVFVFKETGEIPCAKGDASCYYIDFGFFAY